MNRSIKTLALTASLVVLAACTAESAHQEEAPTGDVTPAPVANSSDVDQHKDNPTGTLPRGSLGGLTAMQRLEKLGLTDVRGIAYDPGPDALNGKWAYKKSGDIITDDKPTPVDYTIYYDSDFASADFSALWGKGPDGRGRDDLRRFKTQLNTNLITLYDWNAGSSDRPVMREHKPFFEYADSLGMKATAAVGSWIFEHQLCRHDRGTYEEGLSGAKRVVEEIYPNGKPIAGLGMIKIFNEPDAKGCPSFGTITADTIAQVVATEDALGVADADRVPIFAPVTYSIYDGLPGGALGDIHAAVIAHPKLGETFWKERMVIAVNPFNHGYEMKQWLTADLPAFQTRKGISKDTPVIFTEYGKTTGELNDDVNEQAKFVDEQFQAMKVHPTPQFVGTVAFLNQVRPWETGTEVGFGLMEFGGDGGGWNLPANDYLQTVEYRTPHEKRWNWKGTFPVLRQTPRPAYYKVAEAYKR